MFVKSFANGITVSGAGDINLDITLDCGQAFRWSRDDDGRWHGVVRGVQTSVRQTDEGLEFYGIDEKCFNDIFYPYFDFDRNYGEILKAFSEDELLCRTASQYGAVRILRQEPWETLCSFIISACNNIPRIKGIVERLCENFGEKTGDSYSFPTAERIASLESADLDVIRAGYRNVFILDAARRVASGDTDFGRIAAMDIDSARKELMRINGVGVKVADCTLLYGLGFTSAFPMDRHMKRVVQTFYPDGLPDCIKNVEGIAQQYMFHFQRTEV